MNCIGDRMIDKNTLNLYLNKSVGILFSDSDVDRYIKGKLISISDNAITIQFDDTRLTSVAIDVIKTIKEVG